MEGGCVVVRGGGCLKGTLGYCFQVLLPAISNLRVTIATNINICSCSSCSQQQRKPPVAQAEKQRKALQQGVFQAPQQTENQFYKSVAGTSNSKHKVRLKNGLHLYDKFVNQHLVLYLVTIAEIAPHAITSIKTDSE